MRILFRLARMMLFSVGLFPISFAVAQLQVVGDGGPGPVKAQHLTAELTSNVSSIAPGQTIEVGLVLTMEEHWHVYWKNAGDSGEPPQVGWILPKGISAGPMQFPIPSRIPYGPLTDYGYEDEVAFPMTITAAFDLKASRVHLDAAVTWLVCSSVCIPGKAHMGLDLPVTAQPAAAPARVGALGEALTLLPKPLDRDQSSSVIADKNELVLTVKTGTDETEAEFYPADPDQIVNVAPQIVEPVANGIRIRLKRADELTTLPKDLRGVVKLSDTEAYEIVAPVTAGVVPPIQRSGSDSSTTKGATSGITTAGAIGLAFLGGVILNLMPCVFPVLFLKGLALVQSSADERSRLRAHGLVYTLGILVSFWIIVGVLLALRSSTNQIGWGFQLQSPIFLAVLALGLFFFSLSLAGQFELGLSLTSAGDSLTRKQGYAGSFFTGVLATVVATPCTAPLMGAAIGFALAQPAGVTFAVFTALALGLAAPYLLLSAQPTWTRLLPKPGAWMELLKQLTAVPLFATVIWLTWVYGRLFSGEGPGQGIDHVVRLLIGFLLLAVAGWVLGRWPARWSAVGVAVAIGAIAVAAPLYTPHNTALEWRPYTAETLASARSGGKPVFIDFTAAWCLSCQVNERLVLRSSDVEKRLREGGVTLIKADWTRYDPAITEQLAAVHRNGVPTYVVFPRGHDSVPDVLPELLTKDIVLKALDKDLK